jgi:16S rRNA (adenine1518-N6/adenine1519-N6)-dimethyltransferase
LIDTNADSGVGVTSQKTDSETEATSQKTDSGSLSKPSKSEFLEGALERRSGTYLNVREHSSTEATYQKTDFEEFKTDFEEFRLPSLSTIVANFGLLRHPRFSKSLGQNFILNPEILNGIVNCAGDLSGRVVLEIGAGPGGLTREILRRNPFHVIAIEKDRTCVLALRELQEAVPGMLEVLELDALSFRLDEVRSKHQGKKIIVIANLPYNIGTKILMNFLLDLSGVEAMVLMFQREVAARIMAQPRSKEYGKISVLAQYLTSCELAMSLAPGAFVPAPKVHSCLLKFVPRLVTNGFAEDGMIARGGGGGDVGVGCGDRVNCGGIGDCGVCVIESDCGDASRQQHLQTLMKILALAFQGRRKTIKNALKNVFKDCSATMARIGKKDSCRAEELSVQDFVLLARIVEQEQKSAILP